MLHDNTETTQSDETILEMSLSDPNAFGVLIERYQAPLMRAALRILRDQAEAEDAVQESFTKIYFAAPKFKQTAGASFKSWAYRITLNTAVSHYRKLKRRNQSQVSLEAEHYENLGTTTESDQAEAIYFSRELLAKLPADLRRLMIKYYLEDKSYEEIAREERISLTTLKMRLFRARRVLKSIAL